LPEPEVRLDDCDHSILLTLVERQFTLVEEWSPHINLPRTTIHRRLTKSLGFRVRHFRRVPNLLSHSQNWIAWHCHRSCCQCSNDKNSDLGTTSWLLMTHGSTSIQSMSSYSFSRTRRFAKESGAHSVGKNMLPIV
jgi:hypothetical protein